MVRISSLNLSSNKERSGSCVSLKYDEIERKNADSRSLFFRLMTGSNSLRLLLSDIDFVFNVLQMNSSGIKNKTTQNPFSRKFSNIQAHFLTNTHVSFPISYVLLTVCQIFLPSIT